MKKFVTLALFLSMLMAVAACDLLPGSTAQVATVASATEEAPTDPLPTEPPPTDELAEEAADGEEMAEATSVSEIDLQASPYAALATQNLAIAGEAMAACPQRPFPIPDPDSNAKRPLDFSPFAEALAGFTPEMATTLDGSLINASLTEIQALLNNGEVSSEQLLLYYLDRIQRYDVNRLNSIMELNPAALADAQAADANRPADAGPLYGVPLVIKDNIAVAAPLHTSSGNYALKDWQASRDAVLVQQLRDAGAVILGKANLSEWANYADPCLPNGYTSLGGQVRHAWGGYDPLGSSTGSAVSVSANLVPVSIGSETSGSLTAPARTSGVVGMRPSQGIVSGDFVIPLESNLDTAGPMGHSVSDVAILLTALAADSDANAGGMLAGTDFTQYLSLEAAQELKVGVVLFDATVAATLLASGQTEEVLAALTPEEWQQGSDAIAAQPYGGATQRVIDALNSQGIETVQILESEMPFNIQSGEAGILDYGFQNSFDEFAATVGDELPVSSLAEAVDIVNEDPANRAPYGQRYVEWSVATETTAEQYEQAVADGVQYYTDWFQWFKDTHDVDVVLMGILYQNAGLAHPPALNVPTGRVSNPDGTPGEPSGVLISGPFGSDGNVLAVGYALEQALGIDQQPDLEATMEFIAPVLEE